MSALIKRLILIMVICFCAGCTKITSQPVVLVAGSDYQFDGSIDAAERQVSHLLKSLQSSGIHHVDAFFFCGDYEVTGLNTNESIDSLKRVVRKFDSESQMIFVQGNHDNGDSFSSNVYDTEDYGAYVIHEDMYPFCGDDINLVNKTAADLSKYLHNKIIHDSSKPVFIFSHLPLHYTMRTFYDADVQYGSLIVDVINEAASHGLNVYYLYGHNHSNGYDDYLGGAAVYMKPGDTIYVSELTDPQLPAVKKTLNFTYFNAGYLLGYSSMNKEVDNSATMSVILIHGSKVSIERYDQNGKHALKSLGFWNNFMNESKLNYADSTDGYLMTMY
ncbi:MAG: metallophosphoesterase family protein [Erysipelotrichaceae bacterium]|nr:metallophosphoesterase family protein [Erysipelotrichaceae bacterium]